jgi:hypothetical protein
MGSPGSYGAALKAQSQGMSRFLHTGHHEALLPAQVADQPFSLRVWIEMSDLVPLLNRLDERFGEGGQSYCMKLERVPEAQGVLLEMIAELLRAQPQKVRRACVPVSVADRLLADFGIGRIDAYPAYPPPIDQVDLDPADLAVHLRTLLLGRRIPL